MRKILSIVFAVCIAVNMFVVSAFAEDNTKFAANAYFTYEDNESYLVIEGTTPATYSQGIIAVVYDPCFTEEDGMETLRNEYGEIVSDIAGARPLTDPSKIFRVADTMAEDGTFSMKIPIAGVENGQYMIISIAGTGKTSSKVSTIVYYETEDYLNAVTLPAFENATKDTIGELLKEKQYLLGINLNSEYEDNKDRIHSLFVTVRKDDLTADAQSGRKINSTDDVIKAYNIAFALSKLPAEPSAEDVENFVSSYSSVINYDFSENNKDFVLCEESYSSVAATILKEKPAESMKDFAKVITQSVGINMLNSKDSATIAPVVDKYATILGVDPDDYEIYCEKYTAYEVNKAFFAQNFTKPQDVVDAFKDRIDELNSKGNSSSGGGGSSGGSSGGSFGGSSGGKGSSYLEEIVKPAPEKIENNEVSFSDVDESHWAYAPVKALVERKVLNGFEDETFRPDDIVTREQFVKMIVTAFELYSDNGVAAFDDVKEDRWSYTYILTAASDGIVNGVSENEFMPEAKVSRQDAAVMLARLCDKKGISLIGNVTSTDYESISDYAKESVARLTAANIIKGFEDGSFRPHEPLTRAQAAKLINGLIER